MTDQSDKPKLGTRPPLGLKRTVETGKVKQSFSHGRSNTVVVEVKKRRILGKPGEAPPPAEAKPEAAAPAPAPKPAAPAPKPAAPKRPVDDITARKEMQERLLREAEEARMTSLEEARRREDRSKQAQSEDEKRRAEENRKAEEEAAQQGRRGAADAERRAAEEAARRRSRTAGRGRLGRRKRIANSAAPLRRPAMRPSAPPRLTLAPIVAGSTIAATPAS